MSAESGVSGCSGPAGRWAEPLVAAIRNRLRQGLTPEGIALSLVALLVDLIALPLLPASAGREASS